MRGYLRGLEQEFEEGSNAIRLELNRFEEAGLLYSSFTGNKKFFRANQTHPMYKDLNTLIRKYVGVDKIIEWFVEQSGDLEAVYLSGKLAKGLDSPLIDLIIVGDAINESFIQTMANKGEKLIGKKIRWVSYPSDKFEEDKSGFENLLLIWEK